MCIDVELFAFPFTTNATNSICTFQKNGKIITKLVINADKFRVHSSVIKLKLLKPADRRFYAQKHV